MKKKNNILTLTLKKQWFDMISSGIKKEEYRDIKPYWTKRLTENNNFDVKFKTFDKIVFRNGYAKNSPEITIECLGIEIREGKEEWGAKKGVEYFCITLGKN